MRFTSPQIMRHPRPGEHNISFLLLSLSLSKVHPKCSLTSFSSSLSRALSPTHLLPPFLFASLACWVAFFRRLINNHRFIKNSVWQLDGSRNRTESKGCFAEKKKLQQFKDGCHARGNMYSLCAGYTQCLARIFIHERSSIHLCLGSRVLDEILSNQDLIKLWRN